MFDWLTGIFTKDTEPETIGVAEAGMEEAVIDDWKIIAEEEYPEASTYKGPAFVTSIKFKGARIVSLKPDWLLKTVIWGETKKADVAPLKALIKERRIKTPFLGSIFSEYELIFHYHDSPAILCIAACIASVLVASGFLILATKAPEPEDWAPTLKSAAGATAGIASAIKWAVIGVGGIYVVSKLGLLTGVAKEGIKALKS